MGDEHDGGAGLRRDTGEFRLQVLAGHLVQRTERLVHQQQARLLGERAGDGDPLLHAAGELIGIPVHEVGEPHKLGEPRDTGGTGIPTHLVQLERQLDVARDGAPGQQAGLLERDAVVLIDAGLTGGLAEDAELARRCVVEIGDEAQQGRLAASARSDEGDELARLDSELDVGQRHDIPRGGREDLPDSGGPYGEICCGLILCAHAVASPLR